MKELWTTNPFHLMNRPFAEMSYNSSGPNIAPERLLLATRRPSMHHPLASGAPSFDPLRATCRRATNHATHGTTSGGPLQAICPPIHRAIPASPSQAIRHRTAQHPPTPARHPPAPCRQSAGTNRRPNGPQNKPSAQAGALNPRKNTFCVIVNCPLQIKPVFYFLFTSIASPAHRIRVKSSLLRLGRSCLALPFTHLGKDIT